MPGYVPPPNTPRTKYKLEGEPDRVYSLFMVLNSPVGAFLALTKQNPFTGDHQAVPGFGGQVLGTYFRDTDLQKAITEEGGDDAWLEVRFDECEKRVRQDLGIDEMQEQPPWPDGVDPFETMGAGERIEAILIARVQFVPEADGVPVPKFVKA